MAQAELEKSLSKKAEEKPVQNGQKNSVSTQIGNIINVVDSVILDLHRAQNGDQEGNVVANQLISSLSEIRTNTLRRSPVIIWQNPQILLNGVSVIKEPERAPVERLTRYSQQHEDKSLDEHVFVKQFYKTIGMPQSTWSRNKNQYPEVRTIRRGYFKFFNKEDAENIREIYELKKEKKKQKKEKSKRLTTPPEGYISYNGFLNILGITRERWRQIKKKFPVPTRVKVGRKLYLLKTDADSIKKQRDTNAITPRISTLKPRKAEHEELEPVTISEFATEHNSHDLDIFNLHLKDVSQIPMEIKKHSKWSAKILVSQMAANMLTEILECGNLTPKQEQQISQILENNAVRIILKLFRSRLDMVLSKKTLDNVIHKIGKKQKLDSADEFFINSVQNQANWIVDRFSSLNRIRNPEKRESELQKLIDRQIHLVNEGVNARNKLTETNLRLVISIAKKYTWSGFTIADLEDYGCEGLMRAAVKFDWRRGTQFSTYATGWIRQAIIRAIADHADTVRMPVHMHQRLSKLKKEADKLLQEGEDIDMEELANKVDHTGNLAKGLRTRNLASLNSPAGPNQDSFIEDFLEDVKSNMEEGSDKIGMREALMEAFNTLTARERRVLMLRYGLEDGRSRSLDHVAVYLVKEGFARVTRERIRQIESKALRKLRHSSRAKKLRPYFDDDPKALIVHPGEAADVGRKSRRPQKNPIARVFSGRSIARSPAF